MLIRSKWCVLILIAGLVSCKKEPPPPQTEPTAVTYPPAKTDTISVEGEAKVVSLRLVKPAAEMPFLTYVPSDIVDETRSAPCAGHYFVANFAGRRNDDAYLGMCILPQGLAQDSAVAITKQTKTVLKKPAFFTQVTLKLHGLRYYLLIEHYPQEYGDGLGPVIQKILDEWQWLDAS